MRPLGVNRETRQVIVAGRAGLTPRLVRLTLAGSSIEGMQAHPAQDIELLLGHQGKHVKRRYTIRHLRPAAGELDIDVLLHGGEGPGSGWAARAACGDRAEFIGPRGKLQLAEADWHLFVGDDAALPAIAALTEALGPGAATTVLAEIGGQEDKVPVAATRLRWLYRHGAAPGMPGLLAGALDEFRPPAGVGRAYLLGESRTVSILRARLAQLGVSAERTFVKGYWNSAQPAQSRW